MTVTEIISIVNLVGIATILPIAFGLFFEKRKIKFEARQELAEKRYKAIILLAHCFINYEKEYLKMLKHRPDIKSKDELFNELNIEWINMALYSSDKSFQTMKMFITMPDYKTFNELVLAMRRELYGIKSALNATDLALNL